jgi:hypothetical protein
MGEFDDETVAQPAETEPVSQNEPVEVASDEPTEVAQDQPTEVLPVVQPADETVAEADQTDAIQDSLFEEPAPAPAPEAAPEPPTDDELAAAIAASNEQVGTDSTLDDIAPHTTHDEPAEEFASESDLRYGAPWWPFLVYLGLWCAFAGVAIWQFGKLATGTVIYETQQYTLFVFGGLVLAAVGVILILAVWLGARLSSKRHRAGLFTSAFIKGAAFILIGVVVWWGTFMALDYLRLGRLI